MLQGQSVLQQEPTLQQEQTLQQDPALQQQPTLQQQLVLQQEPTLQQQPSLQPPQQQPTPQQEPTLQQGSMLQEQSALCVCLNCVCEHVLEHVLGQNCVCADVLEQSCVCSNRAVCKIQHCVDQTAAYEQWVKLSSQTAIAIMILSPTNSGLNEPPQLQEIKRKTKTLI